MRWRPFSRRGTVSMGVPAPTTSTATGAPLNFDDGPPGILALLAAHEESLRAQHGERITRITVSPTLIPWLKRKFPTADPPLIPAPWAGLPGIPIVEDASFINGRLRIHRGDATEDYFAVPADDPKWLVQIHESVFEIPLPQSPHCTPTGPADTTGGTIGR